MSKKISIQKPIIVAISGTPGTGKTSIAKELSLSKRWKLIEISKFAKKHGLYEKYDRARQTYIVDASHLVRHLKQAIMALQGHNGIIVDGHMAHFLPASYVDLCVIVKADLHTIINRLRKRGYSATKVRENLDSEIFDICLEEARSFGHRPLILDTGKKTIKTLAKKILSALKLRKN